MGAHPALVLDDAAGLADPGPHPAHGAQGRGGEELVGGRPDAQVDLAERLGCRDAGRLEVAQVLDPGGDGHREGVDVGGAGLVQHAGVDGDGAPAVAVGALADEVGERREVGVGAEPGGRAERVEPEVAADRIAVGHDVEEGAGRGRLVGDRRDDDRGEVEPDVGEHLGEVAGAHPVVTDVHPDRADPVLEVVEDGGTGRRGVRVVVQLADVPRQRRVAQLAAAGEGHDTRDAERAVVAEVERVDVQPALEVAAEGVLGGRAVEAGVLGATLVEHRGDEALPVLAALLGEPGGQAQGSEATDASVIVIPFRRGSAGLAPASPP